MPLPTDKQVQGKVSALIKESTPKAAMRSTEREAATR
jgi:hypothetical protein